MKRKSRSEMSKLLWTFTIPVLLLVALIVVVYLIYGIVNADNNAKQTKELLIQQSVKSYQAFGLNFQDMSKLSPELLKQFNPDIVKAACNGDPVPLYGLTKNMMILTNPAKYVAIIENGKVVDSAAAYGTTVDPKNLHQSNRSRHHPTDSLGIALHILAALPDQQVHPQTCGGTQHHGARSSERDV